MIEVTFHPSGQTIQVPPKTNLMAAIVKAELPIGQSCGAIGICTKCTVKVLKGEENLSRPNAAEKLLRKKENLPLDVRVSCQTKVLGPVTITTGYW